MSRKPIEWIKTTIAEPFPVLFSHVNQKGRSPQDAEGPFYAAGSEYFDLYSEQALAAKNGSADYLRALGWTVSVERETR